MVDSEELKRYQGQTVLEAINHQPGFSIKQDGGIGQSSNFYIRGYDSKRVLILIDGVRYGSMSNGQPALGLLPADQIDRIEIIYGASGLASMVQMLWAALFKCLLKVIMSNKPIFL